MNPNYTLGIKLIKWIGVQIAILVSLLGKGGISGYLAHILCLV